MCVVTIDPIQDPRWKGLADRPGSSVFHAPDWLAVLRDTYEFDVRAAIETNATGDINGGIPYCTVRDLRGSRTISLPFSDYCDALVSDQCTWGALAESFLDSEATYAMRALHNPIPSQDERFTRVNQARWHEVDLNASLDHLWERIDPSSRRAIRRARGDRKSTRLNSSH